MKGEHKRGQGESTTKDLLLLERNQYLIFDASASWIGKINFKVSISAELGH